MVSNDELFIEDLKKWRIEEEMREKENIKNKYLKEKYRNIEKNINCCPNKILCCFSNCCKKICSNCCCICCKKYCCCDFYISYYGFFVLSLLMSLGLHVFDVGSDIFVLVDLYDKDFKLFSTCLGIIILSFFAGSMISCFGQTKPDVKPGELFEEKTIKKSKKRRFLDLLLGFFQFGIFIEAYYSIKIGEKTHTFVWSRVIEGLVESCPQSLFQLFIVLKGSETFSFFDMAKYYISIIISLLNLSMVLVTFEIYRYEYERRKKRLPIEGITKITMFSHYGLVLTLYRLTEISSRMGLLGCIGYMYNGYAILIALLFDYLLSIILNLTIVKKCSQNRSLLIFFSFSNILFLPAYWKPFTTRLPGSTQEEYYYDIYHWLSKYLNNGIISVLLVTKLINDTNNLSFTIISISSISCFILNIPLLYFVILWNRSTVFTLDFFYIRKCWCPKRNNFNKFKPLVCCKFNHCCSFSNKIMDASSNIIMDTSSNIIMDASSNIIKDTSSNKIEILSEEDNIVI